MKQTNEGWKNKSDEWLAEVLKWDDEDDRNDAVMLLQERYDEEIKKFIKQKLPVDWVDDVYAEVWVAFCLQAHEKRIRSVPRMLQTISRNKRADAVRRLRREREIETDVAPEDDHTNDNHLHSKSQDEEWDEVEQQILEQLGMTLIQQIPFVDSVLSDCQRTLWVLRKVYKYPSKMVARLMGKSDGNIRKQYSIARKELASYFLSDDFKIAVQKRSVPTILKPAYDFKSAVCVELFAEEAKPKFTRQELKVMGISPKYLHDNYVMSLVIPRWFNETENLKMSPPSILLLHKDVRFEWIKSMYDLKNNPELTDPYAPEQYLVNFQFEDDLIILRPETMVELAADLYAETSDNTYVVGHSPRFISPIIWGYWDSSLYFDEKAFDSEMQQRWPFLPLASDREAWQQYQESKKERSKVLSKNETDENA